jgi:hypothetical protein
VIVNGAWSIEDNCLWGGQLLRLLCPPLGHQGRGSGEPIGPPAWAVIRASRLGSYYQGRGSGEFRGPRATSSLLKRLNTYSLEGKNATANNHHHPNGQWVLPITIKTIGDGAETRHISSFCME